MEWNFRINWQALVEEAKLRRKTQKLTQARLAELAGVSTPTVSRFESGETDIQLPTVLAILGVLGMTDKRVLVFPQPDPRYISNRMVVEFAGWDGEKPVSCAISWEALGDYFAGDNKDPVKVFNANRERIEQMVRRKYLAGQLEPDGSVLVRTKDF